jgi:hypothetical protein
MIDVISLIISELTFHSQSPYILPVQNKKNVFIYLGDRWYPENPIDGTYVWLLIDFNSDRLGWMNGISDTLIRNELYIITLAYIMFCLII